ncbi:ABC transporter substrate-binding protein [Clostridium formicaceticum]|uniref:ABC transporter substrate-binding protein n=1 Tax=Clostridium formicaceticum TaxID=1497 RepID=A0AAC9RM60_9CLOT|nr:ABC transporter substrate-binding protein [Clostridium formicaceticum]AOY77667.1 ABC transporter substrate-binding protein [Clostridium formicaceticum]ARE88254.1 sn-glycerol-3-phosphate-binding periplasmic protein UgpB precursor [Clostridium formicaceticum]
MKKTWKKAILLLVAMVLLVGCASSEGGNPTSTKEGDPIEITFYYPIAVGGALTSVIEKMAEDFMTENPDIKVTPVYTGSYAETMVKAQTAIQGNNAPELAVLSATELYTLLDMDAIIPLDELIAQDGGKEYIEDFYPAFLENSQTGGKTWSIPFQRSTIVLYYNKEAFREAGLDPEAPPKNWEELIAYAKKLTVKGNNGEAARWGVEIPSSGFPYWLFQGFALQNGKNLMNDDGKAVFFDTPENVEALQLWIDLAHKHGVMPKDIIEWATVPSNFIEEKSAMMYHTTGNLTNVKNNAGFEFGVAYMPAGKQYGSPTGGGNFYIFKDVPQEKQEAAWKFIKWVTEPERAAQWSIDTGYVAARASSYETAIMKDYVANFPQAAVARDQLEYASAELSTHNNGRVYKAINDHLQAAIVGDLTAAAALERAQKEAEGILAPFK